MFFIESSRCVWVSAEARGSMPAQLFALRQSLGRQLTDRPQEPIFWTSEQKNGAVSLEGPKTLEKLERGS